MSKLIRPRYVEITDIHEPDHFANNLDEFEGVAFKLLDKPEMSNLGFSFMVEVVAPQKDFIEGEVICFYDAEFKLLHSETILDS